MESENAREWVAVRAQHSQTAATSVAVPGLSVIAQEPSLAASVRRNGLSHSAVLPPGVLSDKVVRMSRRSLMMAR